jgi:hypothetical protein
MKNIIFHIGFSKCASKTIQNEVFATDAMYLGSKVGLPYSKNFAKQFQRIAPVGYQFYGSIGQARNWTKQILKLHDNNTKEESRFIVSSEFLSHRNRLNPRPIIPFLKKFQDEVWYYGKVKVVIVMRNQADKIASAYAQNSDVNRKASQLGFEKHVKEYLRYNKYILNYAVWVEELYENFGKENVCVLLMEEINKEDFWLELKSFCQLDNFDVSVMLKDSKVLNKRSISKNYWAIGDFNFDAYLDRKINKPMDFLWPHFIIGTVRFKVVKVLNDFLRKFYVLIGLDKVKRTDSEISMTETIKNEIMSAYKNSNVKLESLINKDLKELGYYE